MLDLKIPRVAARALLIVHNKERSMCLPCEGKGRETMVMLGFFSEEVGSPRELSELSSSKEPLKALSQTVGFDLLRCLYTSSLNDDLTYYIIRLFWSN